MQYVEQWLLTLKLKGVKIYHNILKLQNQIEFMCLVIRLNTWADKVNKYAFNDNNGDWYKITDSNPLKEGYQIKKSDYIVQRYLCDDLWELSKLIIFLIKLVS
jgi:hypothetical protein